MTDHDTNLLPLAAAAAAGALFMYWVDARRQSRAVGERRGGRDVTREDDEDALHPTAPARAAWNEQGV